MKYPIKSLQTITEETISYMESKLTAGKTIPKASLLGVLGAAVSMLAYLSQHFFQKKVDDLDPETCSLQALEEMGDKYGVPRKPQSYATGTLRIFSTSAGITFVEGTVFEADTGTKYVTDVEVITVDNSGSYYIDVAITAEAAGTESNVAVIPIDMVSPIPGYDSAEIQGTGLTGGTELETETNWRRRVGEARKYPKSSGNASYYVQELQKIAGIGRAWLINDLSQYSQGVELLIAQDTYDPVSSGARAQAETFMNINVVLGGVYRLIDPVPRVIDIKVEISPFNQNVADQIDTNLRDFMKATVSPNKTWFLRQLETEIGKAGASSYNITEIKKEGVVQPIDDIVFTGGELGQAGSIEVETM